MYDLLLKGGTVLDPGSTLDGAMDVAVERGAIARIAPQIAETEAARTIDVRGKPRDARVVRKPIYKTSVKRWKKYGDGLQPLVDAIDGGPAPSQINL